MTTERELLISKFQRWLDTKPKDSLIAAQCATIAEEYASKPKTIPGFTYEVSGKLIIYKLN